MVEVGVEIGVEIEVGVEVWFGFEERGGGGSTGLERGSAFDMLSLLEVK